MTLSTHSDTPGHSEPRRSVIILGIDSTTDQLIVGVSRDGNVEHQSTAGRPHSKELLPLIKTLLGSDRPDAIAVAIGPGSYTGTRVGVTTANMIGWAWGIPVYGINNTEAKSITDLLEQGCQRKKAGQTSKSAFPIYSTTPGERS